MTDLHCWHYFEDGRHTCMLLLGHDGPHESTPDKDILVSIGDTGFEIEVREEAKNQ